MKALVLHIKQTENRLRRLDHGHYDIDCPPDCCNTSTRIMKQINSEGMSVTQQRAYRERDRETRYTWPEPETRQECRGAIEYKQQNLNTPLCHWARHMYCITYANTHYLKSKLHAGPLVACSVTIIQLLLV